MIAAALLLPQVAAAAAAAPAEGAAAGKVASAGSETGWKLPEVDWAAEPQLGPTGDWAVRAFDTVFWPADGRTYLYWSAPSLAPRPTPLSSRCLLP